MSCHQCGESNTGFGGQPVRKSEDPPTDIVVVDDEHLVRWGLANRLRRLGFSVEMFPSAEEALDHLAALGARLVLLDIKLPGMDGMECLRQIREKYYNTTVIMMTGHGSIESSVEAMRTGAHNYVTKPFDFAPLAAMVRSVLLGDCTESTAPTPADTAPRANHHAEATADSGAPEFEGDLVGRSPAMAQIRALALKLARSKARTILLTGESGTGKDHVARFIHYQSHRAHRPLISINVAAVPAALFESELFGHERGSFTDAKGRKKGLLEMAEGGSVYLDEIGELAPELQVNLLRFLEGRTFKRLGGVEEIQTDIRVIAATNADLRAKVLSGTFRQDLYYRLRVIPMHLPALRDRGDDVLELADHFLKEYSAEFGCDFSSFSPAARSKLGSHTWPGNVRELRNAIERAIVLEEGNIVEPSMIKFDDVVNLEPGNPPEDEGPPAGGSASMEEIERKVIVSALERVGWNQVKAAEALGLGRDALRYRMKKHGLI